MLTERDVMLEFLTMYKSLPCLWDPASPHYSNRHARHEANLQLLKVYQRLHPDAHMDMVKKKIEHMRSTFWREVRKVKRSILEGGTIHEPHLWYFKNLLFLLNEELEGFFEEDSSYDDQNKQVVSALLDTKPASRIDKSRVSKKKEEEKYNPSDIPVVCYDPVAKTIQVKKKIDQAQSCNSSILEQSECATENQNQVFGRAIGLQLEELTTTQQFIAQKLISDVIFYGRMKLLSKDSCIKLSEEESVERSNKRTNINGNEDDESVYVNDKLGKVTKVECINNDMDISLPSTKIKRKR